MKKGIAVLLILLSFANFYDTVMILTDSFLPPYTIIKFEVNTGTYLFYKITTAFIMLFVAYKIFHPENDEEK